MKMQWIVGFVLLSMFGTSYAAELELGDWHVIGPFKDEEFGNLDRTLAYEFEVEKDALANDIDISRTYLMKEFPGYLDLERRWKVRQDYADGFYNLLPRGPAPSRMEAVYLYRTIESDCDQTVSMYFRVQDFFKVWINGEAVFRHNKLTGQSRYQGPMRHKVALKKGINQLLVKNVSRWAEHGFAFAIDGMHDVTDPFYVDIHTVEKLTPEQYLNRFKFKAEPIPMYSPERFEIEESLASYSATPTAAAYDRTLVALERATRQVLAEGTPANVKAQADKVKAALETEVKALPPLVFITKPLHDQNAIAPYRTKGSLPSAICLLDPSKPDAEPTVIYSDPKMRIYDMSLSFDGETIFFSAKNEAMDYAWNIYEIGIDGNGFKQITTGDTADISPVELPNGRIAFISTRKQSFVGCQTQYAGLLFTMNRNGSDVRLISANIDSDHSPRVTNDGRIMFTRWDYGIEKNVFARHALWTVNPDGTGFQLVFGNTIEDPGGFWWAHPIPDRPEILAVFGPHHNHHAGMIGLLWDGKGPESPRGTGYRWITREFPVYGDRMYPDGYRTPYPLNEKQFLVSYGGFKQRPEWTLPNTTKKWVRRPESTMAPLKLLLLDAYGNEKVIYESPNGLSVYNAMPVEAKKKPPVYPDKISPLNWTYEDPESMNRSDAGADQTATMMVQDVYQGISRYVKRGEAKFISVIEQVQKSRILQGGEAWGHSPIIGRGTVHARRLVGLVPIEDDGSASFKVPAMRSVSLNVLDGEGKTLMRMGADIHVMPGESISCIGCHEQREHGFGAAPPMQGLPMALKKAPVTPEKQDWGTQGLIDYLTVVQPVWDKHCVECHSGSLPDASVDMTDDKTRFFSQSYEHLVDRDIVDHLSVFSLDHDEGTPNTVGAKVSKIDQYLSKEHCGSEVSWSDRFRVYCWIDANVPYYATYDSNLVDDRPRGLGMRDAWETENPNTTWATGDLQEVFDRRCADCHERDALNQSWLIPKRMKVYSDVWGDKALTSHGFGVKWGLVNKLGPEFRINLTHPSHSLLLQAPLSEASGGAGLCKNQDGSPVFADKADPDYQKSLKAIHVGSERLKQNPRIDMLGKESFVNALPACSDEDGPSKSGKNDADGRE
ncbi:hypothetical protein CA13_67930 [Planctomycetes bacterium CA13]|uniref:Hydrazine synthase alpha subunit middle domain-containing protein n=1 Tax=Novipirellula herctigrandis TaxID=2527986 RepID=A0A5C5YNC8_9BACT|nr:hypothetical protein CA13_67930 [Planctomycetes bacterium CA13]